MADIMADIKMADRGETISLMEPLRIGEDSRHRTKLTDLAFELAQGSAAFRSSLPTSLLASLATLVRSMNCYYSNLIEGHNTTLREIERAMAGQLDTAEERRNLQVEARAHILVQ